MRTQSATEFPLINQDKDAVRAPCPEVWKHESLKEVRVKRIGCKERDRVPRLPKEITRIHCGTVFWRLLTARSRTISPSSVRPSLEINLS